MTSSNPFDFSDFGPPQHGAPQAPSAPAGGAPTPGPAPSGPSGGFDPWAGAPASGGPGAAPGPDEAFGTAAPSYGSADGRDAFGQLATPAGGALTTASAPVQWLALALGLAVLGAILAGFSALAGPVIWAAIAGWLLAGPVAIGAVALYNRVDTKRRAEAIYSAPGWVGTAYWVVLGTCLIGIALGAWQIALWAGKL